MTVARCPHARPHVERGWGWVYGVGPVALITCQRETCRPDTRDSRWFRGVEIVPEQDATTRRRT
jgi:hypothetical protein